MLITFLTSDDLENEIDRLKAKEVEAARERQRQANIRSQALLAGSSIVELRQRIELQRREKEERPGA